MKIFIVQHAYAYEGDQFVGAFDTFEKAQEVTGKPMSMPSHSIDFVEYYTENGAEFTAAYNGHFIIETELNKTDY